MNVLFITDILPVGGSRTYFIQVAAELQRQGHTVFLIAFTWQRNCRFSTDNFAYIDLIYIEAMEPRFFSRRTPLLYQALRRLLFKQSVDIILTDLAFPAFSLLCVRPFFPKLKTVPVIHQFHGLDSLERGYQQKGQRVSQFISRVFYRLRLLFEVQVLCRLPKRVIVFSDYAREQLVQHGVRTKVVKVAPGVNTDLTRLVQDVSREAARRQLHLPQTKRLCVLVSRIEFRKGVLQFLRDYSRLRPGDFELILALTFTDEYPEHVFRQMIKQLDLRSTTFLFSSPDSHDLAMLYRAADVTVVPSLDLETFGFVTLESMSIGTPVVGYDIGANSELIKTQQLAPVAEPEQLIRIIRRLLRNSKIEQQKLSRQLVQTADGFSWRTYVKRLVAMGK